MKKLQKETIQSNQAKVKKPFYKRWYTWAIAIVIVGAAAQGNDAAAPSETETKPAITEPAKQEEVKAEPVAAAKEEPKKEETKVADNIPKEFKSALKKAESYAKTMNMSKSAIHDQLTSEYGEKFSVDAANYAMDNLVYDWKENALIKAKTYQDSMDMSVEAIRDQLTSEYGEKFTQEEADFAIENLDQ